MPVRVIERIEAGVATARVERGKKSGKFECHHFGSNVAALLFDRLDDVAEFLRANPRSGVRMNPGWSKIVEHVFIDGSPR